MNGNMSEWVDRLSLTMKLKVDTVDNIDQAIIKEDDFFKKTGMSFRLVVLNTAQGKTMVCPRQRHTAEDQALDTGEHPHPNLLVQAVQKQVLHPPMRSWGSTCQCRTPQQLPQLRGAASTH